MTFGLLFSLSVGNVYDYVGVRLSGPSYAASEKGPEDGLDLECASILLAVFFFGALFQAVYFGSWCLSASSLCY